MLSTARTQKVTIMTKKILIDAHQPEETRVVLLNGNRIEEFDYENTNFQQLKGNVYLARVTRVEPSLQAAFVEYGGNRQGFLAFSEIHPDYYRIPIEDRDALVAEVQQEEAEDSADEIDEKSADSTGDNTPETLGGEDVDNHSPKSSAAITHRYKIQEVISRKQILLVQVVKEERGNKGAALTTYLSLAGRYCVLMPNSSRSGGVSRKITNVPDRKRLKTIVNDLDVPNGMAVIVRTAGSKRTKTEIKRDYAYLSKLWDEIRQNTLQSEAPALIHEEGSLVKRSIRDLYTNDVEEVLIEGDEAYKVAKAQMKMLIPSHAKRVLKYEDNTHLFQNHNVEPQLDTIHRNEVTLKSGGYLVINQTEALVAIDVNSGKATRERNIEETALKTNLEAAEEVGRQLRLRDLSGLIVIDFIDMEENRNQNAVERRLKDALRHDRARIQVGSISHFGLLEMSRQRLRPSLVESVSQSCPHCLGTGRVRSVNSSALHVLRLVEDEASRHSKKDITVYVHPEVALYILNQKRSTLAWLENQFSISIMIEADPALLPSDCRFDGQRQEQKSDRAEQKQTERPQHRGNAHGSGTDHDDEQDDDQPKRRRRGRRGGRHRKKRGTDAENQIAEQTADTENLASEADAPQENAENHAEGKTAKRGRRRRKSVKPEAHNQAELSADDGKTDQEVTNTQEAGSLVENAEEAKTAVKKTKKAAKAKAKTKAKTASDDAEVQRDNAENNSEKPASAKQKPKAKKAAKGTKTRKVAAKAKQENTGNDAAASDMDGRASISSVELNVVNIDETSPTKPKRAGWWSR